MRFFLVAKNICYKNGEHNDMINKKERRVRVKRRGFIKKDDPLGSYTGTNQYNSDLPEQDADDL